MADVLLMVIDNSYSSQNQDYAPNRFLAQKSVIDILTGDFLRAHPENEVGIIELAQRYYQIITPTRDRNALDLYLSKVDLDYKVNTSIVLDYCFKALDNRTQQEKTLLLFLGSILEESIDKEISTINEMLDLDYHVKIVFFGEAIVYSERFEDELIGKDYMYVVIGSDDDFLQSVRELFGKGRNMDDDDPEMAYAIQASLREQ